MIWCLARRFGRPQTAFEQTKFPRLPDPARLEALLEREYHTLVRLAHPRIIEVYCHGVTREGPCYTKGLQSRRKNGLSALTAHRVPITSSRVSSKIQLHETRALRCRRHVAHWSALGGARDGARRTSRARSGVRFGRESISEVRSVCSPRGETPSCGRIDERAIDAVPHR